MVRVIRRRLLPIVLAALVASASSATGHAAPDATAGQDRRYEDPAGWSLEYPESMVLERSGARLRVTVSEVTVASFEPRTAVASGRSGDTAWIRVDRPLDAQGEFPSDGIAFRIVRREGGPLPNPELPETRFPLRLATFQPSGEYPGTKPRPAQRTVVANGRTYLALAWIGESASPELRAALERIVSSLSFPRLRPGTVVGYGFTVLQHEGRYPVGSFMRARAQGQPFYLVHAPGGFYAVGWRRQSLAGGYKSRCELEFDARRREFFCTNLRARWDRVGRVLVRPHGARRGDPLNVAIAKVGWDGHVLLHAGTARFADARLARALWPGWRVAR